MIVKVTEKHIQNGIPCSNYGCPVALALEEATGNKMWSVSGRSGSLIFSRNSWNYYKRPRSIDRFVYKFDSGKEVKPFNFKLIEVKYEDRISSSREKKIDSVVNL